MLIMHICKKIWLLFLGKNLQMVFSIGINVFSLFPFPRFFDIYFLLALSSLVSGRELECSYDTYSDYSSHLWATFNQCKIKSVNLSETFRNDEHSFSGTAEQKSAITVVYFYFPSEIDFLPKEILNDFPQLNGLMIRGCQSFKTVKNDFVSQAPFDF
jgi:hypothetical protein